MRKFQFRFETVERVRREKEREAMRALAGAQARLRAAHERKTALIRELEASLDRRERLGSEPVGIEPFLIEDAYIEGTKVRMLQSDHLIERARKDLARKIDEYLKARRRTKVMEKLRERELRIHRKERAKAERKELDDVYVMRARFRGEPA